MIQALVLALHALAVPQLQVPERARDPWVFRSVLDGHARIVTLALCKEMWLAYDAQTCGLFKCWKGGVKLEGAVYTTVHGDQPTSTGTSYVEGLEGAVWSAEVKGQPCAVKAVWRGYFLREGRAHLQYEIFLPSGEHVAIQETADYTSAEQVYPEGEMAARGLVHGMPCLYRSFWAEAVPDDVVILLETRARFDAVRWREVFPPGTSLRDKIVEEPQPGGEPVKIVHSWVPFTKDVQGVNVGTLFDPLPDPVPPPKPDAGADKAKNEKKKGG